MNISYAHVPQTCGPMLLTRHVREILKRYLRLSLIGPRTDMPVNIISGRYNGQLKYSLTRRGAASAGGARASLRPERRYAVSTRTVNL